MQRRQYFEMYVLAGIAATKVLKLATWGTSVYTGKSNEYGNIAVGKKADLILLEGNLQPTS